MKIIISSITVLVALNFASNASADSGSGRVVKHSEHQSFAANAYADVTGEFKDVDVYSDTVFSIMGAQTKYALFDGNGTLKNKENAIVANNNLKYDVDGIVTIQALKGATFVHKPNSDSFAADVFSNKPVTEFAAIKLGDGNQWTVNDTNFLFVIQALPEIPLKVDIALDRSLARASSITLPKGTYTLWGYTITIEKATGTVKFAHGKIVDASDATFISK